MFEDVKIQGLGLRSFVHACDVAEQVVALASRLRIIIILREETPFLYYIEKSGPFSPRHAICLKVKMNGGAEREKAVRQPLVVHHQRPGCRRQLAQQLVPATQFFLFLGVIL
jgi:hypothetical protein